MTKINHCLNLAFKSLTFHPTWYQVPSDGECLHVQYMGQCNGYLIAWARRSGGTLMMGLWGQPTPCQWVPSPQNLCSRCTSPADHSSNQSAIAGHHRRGWELQNVHFLRRLTLLVHSQIVHKLCAGFSINSLSFSQFHPLLFQTEKDHKQLLHKSKLFSLLFLLFLTKSAWSLLPLYTDQYNSHSCIPPRPGGECIKRQNVSGSVVICICAKQA